jgi:hypothetical protein
MLRLHEGPDLAGDDVLSRLVVALRDQVAVQGIVFERR